MQIIKSSKSCKSWYNGLLRLYHSSLLPEEINNSFQKTVPKIIKNITQDKKYLNLSEFENKIQKAFKYNMTTDNIGSVSLLHAYNEMEKAQNIAKESLQKVFVLAWAVEMVQFHNLIMENTKALTSDDTWSANDADLLRSFMHIMIKEHFDGKTCYKDLVHYFNKGFLYSALARDKEIATSKSSNPYINFNAIQYNMLCEYKTAYPSFTLPLSVVMKLTYKTDEQLNNSVTSLCSEMGKLYQIQKDYHNCFGNEAIIGTEGTDIQRGKCTWLAVTALQRFTPRQRLVFTTCYGNDAPAHIERVKLLYKQVQLPQLFGELQTSTYGNIKHKAEELVKNGLPYTIILKLLDKIVRDKIILVNEVKI